MSDRRLLIIAPRWRDPLVQDWTGCRSGWRYTVVQDLHLPAGRTHVFQPIVRRWTWRGAAKAREASRGQ